MPSTTPSYLTALKDRQVGETNSDVFGEEQVIADAVEQHIQPIRDVAYQEIEVSHIRPNPFQGRADFDQEDAQEGIRGLAISIQQHGFLGMLAVRPDPNDEGYYQLAFGERRWRATQLVPEVPTIPCKISQFTDDQMEDIGLIENVQRRDLNPLDEAIAFQKKLEKTNPSTGEKYSIRTLAEKLGVKRHRIEEPLRLVGIPQDVQQMVRKRSDTERVAFEISKLPTVDLRRPLIQEVLQKSMNARQVISTVDSILMKLEKLQEQRHDTTVSSLYVETATIPPTTAPSTIKTSNAQSVTGADANVQNTLIRSGIGTQEQEDREEFKHTKSRSELLSEKSILQSKREKKIQQDSQTISEILHRWSNWVNRAEVEPADLVTYVVGWSAEMDELMIRLKQGQVKKEE